MTEKDWASWFGVQKGGLGMGNLDSVEQGKEFADGGLWMSRDRRVSGGVMGGCIGGV